jgi:hypothetical protein
MTVCSAALLAFAAVLAGASAQDSVELADGTVRAGRVVGADEKVFRLSIPAPVAGQPAATVSVNRADVERIVFGPDADLEAVSKDPVIGRTAFARVLWQRMEPFLAMPESPAAKAAIVYGDILLLSQDPNRHREALSLFTRVESEAWDESDRESAMRGRLKAMLALGQAEEVSREAETLALQAEDPGLLLDTKLLLAETRLAALRQLLGENPRWTEDPPVRAERDKLLNEALDLALHPFLFHGTAQEQAAKGLWLAREAYLLADQPAAAREVATDITTMYPQTRHAAPAREALQKEKPES